MYNDNFKLIENPFGDLSEPKFVYLGGDYQSTFENLKRAIQQRAGLILLTGPSGIGKTVVVDRLVKSLRPDTTTVLFQNKSGDQNLIRYICDALGLSRAQQEMGETQDKVTKVSDFIQNINELDPAKLLDFVNQNLNLRCEDSSAQGGLLRRHLSEEYRKQRNLVVVIDNVANLSRDLLDETIGLVANADDDKKIQLIVTCTPEVGKELRDRYAEAIASTYRLSPLDSNLIEEYIMHLMKAAGFDGENPFSSDALDRILDYAKGIPSQINALCQSSIFTASFEGQKAISPEMIEAASLHQNYIDGIGNTTSSSGPASPHAEEISQGLASLREQRSPVQIRKNSEIKTPQQGRSDAGLSPSIDERIVEPNEPRDKSASTTPGDKRTIIERLSEIQYKNNTLRSTDSSESVKKDTDGKPLPLNDADEPPHNGLRVAKSRSDASTNSSSTIIEDPIEPMTTVPAAAIESEKNPNKTESIANRPNQIITSAFSKLPLTLDNLGTPRVLYSTLFLIGLFGYFYIASNSLIRDEKKSVAHFQSQEEFSETRRVAEAKNPSQKTDQDTKIAGKKSNHSKSDSGEKIVLRFADLNSNTQDLLPDLAEAYLKYTGAQKTSIESESDNKNIRVHGELGGVKGVRNIVVEKAGDAPILLDFINRDGIDFGISSQQLIGSNPFQDSSDNLPDQRIIAIAGIAVIVHPGNPAMIISQEQLADVLSGLVTNWWQLDQKARGINIYLPVNDTSEFHDKILARELGEMFYPNNVQRFQDESKLAEEVANDTNAIGIVRVPYIGSAKSIAITSPGESPVLPSQANIMSNEYPFAQPIYLYANSNEDSFEYDQFIKFMQSDTARRIIRANGFIPFGSPKKVGSKLSRRYLN